MARRPLSLLLCAALLFAGARAGGAAPAPGGAAAGFPQVVRIGIEETLDPEFFVETMGPTMARLRAAFPEIEFKTQEYGVTALSEAVRRRKIDFFMSESGLFAYEARARGVKDIAVRSRPAAADPSRAASSVVVVRADRTDLRTFADLRGHSVAADSPQSFEGWLIVQAVLADKGFDPDDFWGARTFTHYRSPSAAELLLAREADVGILKACDFEQLLASRSFRGAALRVIEPQRTGGLACLHSAPLYPDVVFAAVPGNNPAFLKALTLAILTQPPSYKGFTWGAVGDFSGVDNLYRSLRLGPYAYLRELNWRVIREEYLPYVLGFLGLLVLLVAHSIHTNRLVNLRTRQLRETLERQVALEKDARVSRTRLSQMERAGVVSQMSGMLAHEMLQPVTSILNFAGGLRMYVEKHFAGDAVVRRASEAISEEARRIAAIVEHVRSYAKNEDAPRTVVRASGPLESALRTFGHSATSEGVAAAVNVEEDPLVEVNKLEVELVLFNLMKNAAAAMQNAPQKRMRLTVSRRGAKAVFAVRDYGPPISDEIFAQLAEPIASLKKDGLGLGLSLSKAIVERHGGRLVFTRLSDGLAAEVILPVADDSGPNAS